MYVIYAYIDPPNHPNVGIYDSPMECLGDRFGALPEPIVRQRERFRGVVGGPGFVGPSWWARVGVTIDGAEAIAIRCLEHQLRMVSLEKLIRAMAWPEEGRWPSSCSKKSKLHWLSL